MGGGHLDGVRVLDFGIWRPVPYATRLLADLGADVIKVEPPGGDPMRAFPRLFAALTGRKRSVVCDLRTVEGRERALDLAAGADVVTEGFRPGVAERLGIGYEAVRARNPAVVYCSISGYGQWGPLADLPGHDVDYQAFAGALAPQGEDPPLRPALPVADLAAGLVAAFAICAALLGARARDTGERIDIAMADVVATWVGPPDATVTGEGTPGPDGVGGYGTFRAADGRWLALGVIAEDHLWAAVCRALGLADLAQATFPERIRDARLLNDALASRIARLGRDDAVATLAGAGAPVAPVLTAGQMAAHEHFRARGAIVAGPDGIDLPGHPARFEHHPPAPPGPPPLLDEHREEGWKPR
jgi:crotonobetainyl-CoA:carnitine CoA-transferase CaiB-like acyl-CoA transferase